MNKPKLAYIGIGLMGLPMTLRLLSLGYRVRVFDIASAQCTKAHAAGATVAISPADAALGADFILTNLPTGDAVEQAVFGAQYGRTLASAMTAPQLLIDFSTLQVAQGKSFAGRLRKHSACAWIDAPVSGGPPASAEGRLTIMAGGSVDDIARVTPLMQDIAGQFTHMGPLGSGLATKMLNQLIVGCIHTVMAEAASLAEVAGIDAALLPQALLGGHADGTLLQRLYPRMIARDFKPQGYARQLLKDLEMVHDYATILKTPSPMLNHALALYRQLISEGHSELDTGAIYKLYQDRSI